MEGGRGWREGEDGGRKRGWVEEGGYKDRKCVKGDEGRERGRRGKGGEGKRMEGGREGRRKEGGREGGREGGMEGEEVR